MQLEEGQQQKINWYGWLVCSLGALFYCYEFYLRIAPSVMKDQLEAFYHIQAGGFGHLVAYYAYAYAPMQLFVGLLMDRYGPRRLLTMACACCGLGSLLFGLGAPFAWAELGRFLIGFGSAFAFVGALKLATIWLPPRYFGFVSGGVTCLGMVGAIIGDSTLARLVSHMGWQNAMLIAGGCGLVLAVLIAVIVRDQCDERYTKAYRKQNKVTLKQILLEAGNALKFWQLWIVGIMGLCLYMPLSVLASVWGPSFIHRAYDVSQQSASDINAMIFLGWAIGGPLIGMLSDYSHRRKLWLFWGSACSAGLAAVFLYVKLPIIALYPLLLVFGICNSVEVLVFAVARESFAPKIGGTVLALVNMFVMVSGMIFQPLTGSILQDLGHGIQSTDHTIYPAGDYRLALSVIVIGLVLSAILSLTIKESYQNE